MNEDCIAAVRIPYLTKAFQDDNEMDQALPSYEQFLLTQLMRMIFMVECHSALLLNKKCVNVSIGNEERDSVGRHYFVCLKRVTDCNIC